MVVEDNGVLTQAKNASKTTNASLESETVHMSVAGSYNNSGNLDLTILLTNLNSEVPEPKTIQTAKEDNQDTFPVIVTAKYGKYEIDGKGNIEKITGLFLEPKTISFSDEKTVETITAMLTQDLSGTIEWSLENGIVDGDIASNSVVSITPLTGNSITVTRIGAVGCTEIIATLSGTKYTDKCIAKINSPTDVYVALDTDVLRFYNQKENVKGILYSDDNGPINLRNLDFTSLELSPWYTNDRSKIVKISFEDEICPVSTQRWFYECNNLTKVENINNLNTEFVTNMKSMFYGCSNLLKLDVSNFNMKKVECTDYMFGGCTKLNQIFVADNWKVYSSTNKMFSNCSKLIGGKGTKYNGVDGGNYARIDGGASEPGYFTHINDKGKLRLGEEVIYIGHDSAYPDESDKTKEILCTVLYNDDEYGKQIISSYPVCAVTLGKNDPLVSGGFTKQHAKNSYDNAIENLNYLASLYKNVSDGGLSLDARCIRKLSCFRKR